jgi:hypothetical protein
MQPIRMLHQPAPSAHQRIDRVFRQRVRRLLLRLSFDLCLFALFAPVAGSLALLG